MILVILLVLMILVRFHEFSMNLCESWWFLWLKFALLPRNFCPKLTSSTPSRMHLKSSESPLVGDLLTEPIRTWWFQKKISSSYHHQQHPKKIHLTHIFPGPSHISTHGLPSFPPFLISFLLALPGHALPNSPADISPEASQSKSWKTPRKRSNSATKKPPGKLSTDRRVLKGGDIQGERCSWGTLRIPFGKIGEPS